MKKLKLKLDAKAMLSKEAMKMISGGYWVGCECFHYPGGAMYGSTQVDCQYVSDCVTACEAFCASINH